MPDINMSAFEETRRNQLVTEVDIQTQVALDNYQVQLSDIANPTQSQDNVVIDRHGEFLPHWNESLDFDTWVKMNMEIAGKQILMLRGNSNMSSISLIDIFILGDEHNDASIDTSIWDTANKNGTWNEAAGVLTCSDSDGFWMRSKVVGTDYHIWAYGKSSDMDSAYIMANVDVTTDPWSNGYAFRALANTDDLVIARAGSQVAIETVTLTANTYYYHEIKKVGGNLTFKIYNSSKTLLQTVTYNDGTPLTGDRIAIRGYGETLTTDWIILGKSTTIDPVVLINSEQNIVIALKSLGRAG